MGGCEISLDSLTRTSRDLKWVTRIPLNNLRVKNKDLNKNLGIIDDKKADKGAFQATLPYMALGGLTFTVSRKDIPKTARGQWLTVDLLSARPRSRRGAGRLLLGQKEYHRAAQGRDNRRN